MSPRDTNGVLSLTALAMCVVTIVLLLQLLASETRARRRRVLVSWCALVALAVAAYANYTLRVVPSEGVR